MKLSKRRSQILKLTIVITVIIYVAIVQYHSKNTYPIKLESFHNKKLQGTITKLISGSGGTKISLNSENEIHYLFVEYNDSIQMFFYRFAKEGDSVFKDKNDKYVHLFKNDNQYLFKTIPPK